MTNLYEVKALEVMRQYETGVNSAPSSDIKDGYFIAERERWLSRKLAEATVWAILATLAK